MKFQLVKGEQSVILTVFIIDSSSAVGAGLAALDQTSSIVGGYLKRNGTGVALAVDEDVTTEGTYQAPSAAAKVRIGTPANMTAGTYELHFHNDLFTTADWVTITLGGAVNMAPLLLEIQLTGQNFNTATPDVNTKTITNGIIAAATFAAGAINAAAIADASIDAATFAAGAINAAAIADGAIDAATFAAGAIDAAAIKDGAIDAATFAAGAINDAAIANDAIHVGAIKAGAIDGASIATDAIHAGAVTADAVTKIQSGLATGTNQTTILARLGAFTGTGVNTVIGFFKALMSKTASNPSDVGGTYDAATDSTQAVRDNMITDDENTIENTEHTIDNT